MKARQILVAFGVEDVGAALGNVWRITATKTDFYLDPVGQADAFHLSIHGPSKRTRVSIASTSRSLRRTPPWSRRRGGIMHELDQKGHPFDGVAVASGAYLVARIRWVWDLQRPRFRQAAVSGPLPEMPADASGVRLITELRPNDAADLDVVVAYGKPYWPSGEASERDNSRLSPLQNSAGI